MYNCVILGLYIIGDDNLMLNATPRFIVGDRSIGFEAGLRATSFQNE